MQQSGRTYIAIDRIMPRKKKCRYYLGVPETNEEFK